MACGSVTAAADHSIRTLSYPRSLASTRNGFLEQFVGAAAGTLRRQLVQLGFGFRRQLQCHTAFKALACDKSRLESDV